MSDLKTDLEVNILVGNKLGSHAHWAGYGDSVEYYIDGILHEHDFCDNAECMVELMFDNDISLVKMDKDEWAAYISQCEHLAGDSCRDENLIRAVMLCFLEIE